VSGGLQGGFVLLALPSRARMTTLMTMMMMMSMIMMMMTMSTMVRMMVILETRTMEVTRHRRTCHTLGRPRVWLSV
jgi:hypothetical protein